MTIKLLYNNSIFAKMVILFLFLNLFLLNYLFSQSLYLKGKNALPKYDRIGIEISEQKFDSLLDKTWYMLKHDTYENWSAENCVEIVRITNTIRLKNLDGLSNKKRRNKYQSYYKYVFLLKDKIWFVIVPDAKKDKIQLNYRCEEYGGIEWERFANDNSMYAVVKKE